MSVTKPSDLNRKNISLHLDTYERAKGYGQITDSFSDVIDNIIDFGEAYGMSPEVLREFVRNKHATHEAPQNHNV